MKMKNILYMVSFLTLTGINAAQQVGPLVVTSRPERTLDDVLQELALQRPAIAGVEKNSLNTVGAYGYHIAKYPIFMSAACLPIVLNSKVDIFNGISNWTRYLVCGAVGAAAMIGVYRGQRDAKKQLDNERIIREFPCTERMLNAAAEKVARLENIHGEFQAVQGNLRVLQGGCERAVLLLNELQAESAQTQHHLAIANDQLDNVIARDQKAKALALTQSLQTTMKDTYAIRRIFEEIEKDSRAGIDVRKRLSLAMGEFAGMRSFQDVTAQISRDTFGEDLHPRHQSIFRSLMVAIQPMLEQQNALRLEMQTISNQLSLQFQSEQQAEQLRLDNQRQLALEAAAVVREALPIQPQVVAPLVLENNYGLLFGSVRPVQQSFRMMVKTMEVAADEAQTSGNESDLD